jgi:hypothetical protein
MVPRPVILFGPSDRHNLGDLLFARVHEALWADRPITFAGLAARDLRPLGGVAVQPLAEVLAALDAQARPASGPGAEGLGPGRAGDAARPAPALLHTGGEVLTCPAWHAAVMLRSSGEVPATVAWLERDAAAREAWLRACLGTPGGRRQAAPYVASRLEWPGLGPVAFDAVGGVDLDIAEPDLRREVIAKLRAADRLAVRDATTLGHLAAAGLEADRVPDSAVLVGELFGSTIDRHAGAGEPAAVRAAMPGGYLALQVGPEFVDDATLGVIGAAAGAIAFEAGLGVVLFRAGAAPWHDDLEALHRLAGLVEAAARPARGPGGAHAVAGGPAPHGRPVHVFASLHLWDLCALVAGARAYAGSSLHGAIVASAYARPAVGLSPVTPSRRPGKLAAYVQTWETPLRLTPVVEPAGLAPALRASLAVDPCRREAFAAAQVARYRDGLAALRRRLDG